MQGCQFTHVPPDRYSSASKTFALCSQQILITIDKSGMWRWLLPFARWSLDLQLLMQCNAKLSDYFTNTIKLNQDDEYPLYTDDDSTLWIKMGNDRFWFSFCFATPNTRLFLAHLYLEKCMCTTERGKYWMMDADKTGLSMRTVSSLSYMRMTWLLHKFLGCN